MDLDIKHKHKHKHKHEIVVSSPTKGLIIYKSTTYHNRYECCFLGPRGGEIRQWLRDTFGQTDDMMYASGRVDYMYYYDSVINDHQLVLTLLRWI
jgi:hypothetical protein